MSALGPFGGLKGTGPGRAAAVAPGIPVPRSADGPAGAKEVATARPYAADPMGPVELIRGSGGSMRPGGDAGLPLKALLAAPGWPGETSSPLEGGRRIEFGGGDPLAPMLDALVPQPETALIDGLVEPRAPATGLAFAIPTDHWSESADAV